MTNRNTPPDASVFRRVLSHYPTGVSVVTATDSDGSHVGFVVGTFNSVSLDPPLIGFFVDKRSTSWARIAKIGKFCVNILSSGQHEVCRRFAVSGGDKFNGVSHRANGNGSPILDGVVAWLECSLDAVHEAGDHFIALGLVTNLAAEAAMKPLLFHQGELVTVEGS